MALFKVLLVAVIFSLSAAELTDPMYRVDWALENQFPHHVAILPRTPQSNYTVPCSGAIIAKGWALTSATCVLQSNKYEVRFGSVNHYTGGNVVISREAHVHPSYNQESQSNNIGLIRTPNWGGAVIPLAPANWNLTGYLSHASGWSQLFEKPSPILQYTFGNVTGPFDLPCRTHFWDVENPSERLCVTFKGQTGCFGDSGSPLMIWAHKKSYLVGIASFNAGDRRCSHTSSTSLFASLTQGARSWIAEVTGIKL